MCGRQGVSRIEAFQVVCTRGVPAYPAGINTRVPVYPEMQFEQHTLKVGFHPGLLSIRTGRNLELCYVYWVPGTPCTRVFRAFVTDFCYFAKY
eukprot:519102-Rhodomonas_salina.2